MAGGTSTWSVQVTGLNRFRRAFNALSENDAPFLREALEKAAGIAMEETRSRAPGTMPQRVIFRGVSGKGAALRALIQVRHKGAVRMEFGRLGGPYKHKRGGQRGHYRERRAGYSYKTQPARPFVGIKGGGAQAAANPRIKEIIEDAISREFERVATGPD